MKWNLFDDESKYLDRFGLLLIVTTIAVITLSLIDLKQTRDDLASTLAQLTVSVFVGATLLLALQASGVTRRVQLIANVVVGIGVALAAVLVILEAFSEAGESVTGSPEIVWIVLSVLAPVLVLRRLIRHRRASGRTLLGAVSAYLLIALAFDFTFLALDAFGEPFFGTEEPTTSFMYFSLVTLTTLGYGDLSAAEPVGRLLTTIEAVVGQVYLVTFVAMIVGLIVAQRKQRTDESSFE